tara:strand:+ start:1598 stop:3394 length:1797 start_codon:yes stop_codon:yes gene_type:complete
VKVTIFKNIYDKSPIHTHVSTALRRIQDGKSSTLIKKVRKGDKEKKKDLPVVCFSGEFYQRKDDALLEHSSFIVLDFDHVDVNKVKDSLAVDDFVYSCWTSPSGDGVKALVRITNPERHKDHFRSLIDYFDVRYNLEVDPTGINESRACFESYDPDIIIKDDYKRFGKFSVEKVEPTVEVTEGNYTDYNKLALCSSMIRNAKDGEKHSKLIKAATLCGGYISAGRMEEEEVIRVLTREISKRDVRDLDAAIKSIRDGIENGKTLPIRDIISDEKAIKRQLLIEDGDMSFISCDSDDFKWINDYSQGLIQLGLDTGDNLLDEYFRYKKEFLIINGHSNVGKTTTALYLICNAAIRHKWKWVLYSSENTTASVKMQLMQFSMDKKVEDMNYWQRKQAYQWVSDNFTIISNKDVYSYSDILVFIEKIMHQKDVDAVFIDPYNSLKLDLRGAGIGVHDYHYEAASEFLTFSKSKDIAVWINMHSVTEAQRKKGDDGLPVAPFPEDTEGGGKFVNRCDCFLTIHRKVQSPDPNIRNISELHVRKVRETETGGRPTALLDPFQLIINPSHTGFISWISRSNLFQPIDYQEAKPIPLNLNFTIDK